MRGVTTGRGQSLVSSGRLVLELGEGDSLRETVTALLVEHPEVERIELVGRGRVDFVRLRSPGEAGPRRGVLDVIQLTGSVTTRAPWLSLLARDADGQLVAGLVEDLRAVELELTAELLSASDFGSVPVSVPAPAKAAPTWAEVAAASAAVRDDDDDEVEPLVPRPGDRIEHAAFGACVVEKLEEDEDFVIVRATTGRLLRLALEVLRLELLDEEGGVRRFRSRPRADKRGRP